MRLTNIGITIIECCIVCALITCIVSLGFSCISFLYKLQVKAEVELLYTTIHSLQQHALTTNKEHQLIFDLIHNTYCFNGTYHALPSSIQFGFIAGSLGPPSNPCYQITKACSFVDNIISFWPDGTIKAGVIYLVDKKKQYAYALSNAVGATSFLRIYEYKQGSWFCLS